MAYAFDKVDDYFRRQKTGQRGSLDKGTQGAPPPTAAAESLAKKAETSAEIGASETGAFRANQAAPQTATQKALVQPAQKQANEWGEREQQRVNEFLTGENKRIQQQYQPFDANDVSKIESGDQGAITKAQQQLGYTGKELTFNPYDVQSAQLDTTSMLRGGVGGIQGALQKQKGGRYTGGMAALDASLLAGNREAMQGTQQQLGDIYQGARQREAGLEKLASEQPRQQAEQMATGISGAAKDALTQRNEQWANLYKQNVKNKAERASQDSKQAIGRNEIMKALSDQASQMYGQDAYKALRFGLPDKLEGFYTSTPSDYTEAIPSEYANIAAALGVQPQQTSFVRQNYAISPQAINERLAQNMNDYNRFMAEQNASIQAEAGGAQPGVAGMGPGAEYSGTVARQIPTTQDIFGNWLDQNGNPINF